jgi:hypothetical protein
MRISYKTKLNRFFIIVIIFLITGCSPARIVQTPIPTDANKAELVVTRVSSFNSGGVGMVFGANENDYVKLNNGGRYAVNLPAGSYTFFVRATQTDEPFLLEEQLKPGDKLCLKGFANPKNLAKVLMPITYHFSNTFLLDKTAC